MGKCKDLTFSKVVSELFGIYSEIVIVAKIEDKIKLIAPISDDIVVIAPYVDDIETVSNNIDSVKNAYRNAQIAKESSTIATNAKKLAIEKAQEALSSANTAHLSALFAGERAEWIKVHTNPILEHLEVIKLSPQNAQIAKESSTIATNAKN